MKKKIVVMGAGRIGGTIAKDLMSHYDVSVIDNNPTSLASLTDFQVGDNFINLLYGDHKNAINTNAIKEAAIVVLAVPGHVGFKILRDLINLKKDVVDISFFPENAFLLNTLAKRNNVTVVIDCGVAPGLCNMMLGNKVQHEKITYYKCYVGGLPIKTDSTWNYKAPFSPIDVIEEYTRVPRIMKNGKLQKTYPLDSEPYKYLQTKFGKLETFYTDGLRTLLRTMDVPNMEELTLRHPGHLDKIKALKDSGFFSKEIDKDLNISPLEFTSKLLFDKWKLDLNEDEFTYMKIIMDSTEQNKKYTTRDIIEVTDRFDKQSNTSSMARTTGYTCSSVARLILNHKYSQKGIIAPEWIGQNDSCFRKIISDLKKRGIQIEEKQYRK